MAYISYPHPIAYTGYRLENPMRPDDERDKKTVTYDEKTWLYYSYLVNRLRKAQEARDTTHAEFGYRTYLKDYERKEKIANTFLEPKKNKSEKPLSTGTIETKLNALASHINNLNLMPTVYAFDKNNRQLRELGTAFTDVMEVTMEHDGGDPGGDKEKRLLRQRDLLKQGTVFVQEAYLTKYEMKKRLRKAYGGEFSNFAGYEEKLEKVFEGCSRDLLYGPNVYLGDITQYSINDQPYLFTVETMSYDVAQTIYGGFENWKFVRPGMVTDTASTEGSQLGGRTIYEQKFRLTSLKNNQVEIIKYQAQPDDEYAIMINGVLLTPAGFPLSAVSDGGRYNITKQVLYPINGQFAYGQAFITSGGVYEVARALDNMLSLFELKTRKSITTPYVNITNRVIPPEVLDPGNISMGIAPNALQPIGTEGQGVTSSEYQIFKELQDTIEKSTVSNIFQGQQAKSGATATEILEVQRQAKVSLGLIIAACTFLEMKIAYLRLWTIQAKWMEPTGTYSDGSRSYRSVSRETNIPKAGRGERMVILSDVLPPPQVVRMLSLQDEQKKQMPVRRYYLNPQLVRDSQILWRIIVEPKEEETSAFHTLRFREMLGDALSIMQMGVSPNVDGITDEFGAVYNTDKAKFFSANRPQQPQLGGGEGDATRTAERIAGDRAAGNNVNQPDVAMM